MKKIFGIILALLMMFSMSTMAFALDTEAYIPHQETAPDYTVTIHYGGLDAETYEVIEEGVCVFYQTGNFEMTVCNNSEANVKMKDFTLTATAYSVKDNSCIGNAIVTYREAEDGDKVVYTNKDEATTVLKAKFKAFNSTEVYFMVSVNGLEAVKVFNDTDENATAIFKLNKSIPVETTTIETTVTPTVTPTETTTTSTTAAPTETSTVVTTTTPIINEEGADCKEPSNDYKVPEVDEEIPNTGGSKAIGGVITLGVIATGAFILAKKRKSNEENWN
jgi:LPXTG-motif cell wall-anchored protein